MHSIKSVTGCLVVCCCLALMPSDESPAQEIPPSNSTHSAEGASTVVALQNTNPTQRVILPRKGQSEEQQLADQLECYEWTCDQLDWDPYDAYDYLVDEGYALALSRRDRERGLICLAARGAVWGSVVAGVGGDMGHGAEIGATMAVANGIIHSSFLLEPESPQTKQVISRYKRELKKWEKKYAGCLKRKYYKVPSQ